MDENAKLKNEKTTELGKARGCHNSYICNLVLPGAAKSGTSSLHSALDRHPEICMSKPKEPQFFSFKERYDTGYDTHNKIFGGNSSLRFYGESSQCYFAHPDAMSRIKTSLTKPKIIIMLRSPIDRLISQYAWNFRRGTEKSSLELAVRERGETTEYVYDSGIGTYREIGGYVSFSRYSIWVPQWQSLIGSENVLLLSFEDFVKNQQAVLEKCFSFLELDPIATYTPEQRNRTSETNTEFLPSPYRLAARLLPQAIKKNELYARIRQKIWKVHTPEPNVTLSSTQRNWLERMLVHEIDYHKQFLKGL